MAENLTAADLTHGTRVNVKGWGDLPFVIQGAPRGDRVEVASPDGTFSGRELIGDLTIASEENQ